MTTTFTLYNCLTKYLGDGTIDLSSDTIKLALVTSDYIPDATHDVLADVLASPSPEVSGTGYTAGGSALANQTWTLSDSPAKSVFDADDLTFTALIATFRYGILYASKTVGAIVNPLIGYILFDNTPNDIVVNGVDWLVQWNADGIFDIAKA